MIKDVVGFVQIRINEVLFLLFLLLTIGFIVGYRYYQFEIGKRQFKGIIRKIYVMSPTTRENINSLLCELSDSDMLNIVTTNKMHYVLYAKTGYFHWAYLHIMFSSTGNIEKMYICGEDGWYSPPADFSEDELPEFDGRPERDTI